MTIDEWEQVDIDAEAEFFSIKGVKPEPSAWSIDDDLTADWAVRKIRDIERSFDRQEEIARSWISYYQAQIAALEEKKRKQTSFLRMCLAWFFERVEHRKTRAGTEKYDLLSGKLARKPAQQKIAWADEGKTIAWLKAAGHEQLIRTKEVIDKTRLKERLTIADGEVVDAETGEVVPGCTVEDIPEEFKVEVHG